MPPKFIINQRLIRFWARLISGKQRKLSYLLYELMLWDSNINVFVYNWIKNSETILNSIGMSIQNKKSLSSNRNRTLK